MTTSNFPIVITSAGLQPQSPSSLLSQLIALVSSQNPGYTANLPGSLIEDVSSTDVGAMVICDQAKVELVNSLTPYGANEFTLAQLGAMYGVPLGTTSNTSVYVVFSGPPGFVIAKGFVVSDGTYQYIVQDGGVIGGGSVTDALFCVASVSGTWAVPVGTVTQLITSVPSTISLSVTNQVAGVPGATAQTEADYRALVLQAGQASATGMPAMLKTLLSKVPGVQPRLISVKQNLSDQWEVIVGGGDPVQVAYAIFSAVFDINSLYGSVMSISGITKANPGVVTTVLNHGLTTGAVIVISGSTVSDWNGTYTITVLTEKTFSIGVNTSAFTTYVSGGIVTPNPRNITQSIYDYPDTYNITFVNPPQQTVTIAVTWNTSIPNFTQQAAVQQLGSPALIDYVNSLPVGQPMNLFELQVTFQQAIASVVPPALLTRMVFSVNINGIGTSPDAGTGIIEGDPESYFEASATAITITQG